MKSSLPFYGGIIYASDFPQDEVLLAFRTVYDHILPPVSSDNRMFMSVCVFQEVDTWAGLHLHVIKDIACEK